MSEPTQYQKQDYWESRYQQEEEYEWFLNYADLQKHLLPLIPNSNATILILGCGNSLLGVELFRAGFKNIINMDYSEKVVDKQKNKYPHMTWRAEDMFLLSQNYPAKSVDIVIDKGTLDAVLAGENPWNVSLSIRSQMGDLMSQIHSILKDGGLFISITFAQPLHRIPLLLTMDDLLSPACQTWSIEIQSIPHGFHYLMYCFTKNGSLTEEQRTTFTSYCKMVHKPREEVILSSNICDSLEDSADFLLSIDFD